MSSKWNGGGSPRQSGLISPRTCDGSPRKRECAMPEYRTVASASEIPPGTMKLVDLDGDDVVVANVEGTFVAFQNECTHAGGPLSEGELTGSVVKCPWHATVFDVTTGKPQGGPGREPIKTYVVHVEGEDVQIAK